MTGVEVASREGACDSGSNVTGTGMWSGWERLLGDDIGINIYRGGNLL